VKPKRPITHQISVEDLLPLNGTAVNLTARSGRHSGRVDDQQRTLSRLSNKYQQQQQQQQQQQSRLQTRQRRHPYHADDEAEESSDLLVTGDLLVNSNGNNVVRSKSENHLEDLSPPRSPRFPTPGSNGE